MREQELREEICLVGRRLYEQQMAAANDGNLSVRLSEETFLCTPTGVSKGLLTPELLCVVDAGGQVLEQGPLPPSSEIRMHLRVYRELPEVRAVVHAHPPYATAFAIAEEPLTLPIMAESLVLLGEVPLAPYGTPSTEEIPEAIAPLLPGHRALLLAHHGALTYGESVMQAGYYMESVEFYARQLFLGRLLGGPKTLTKEQLERLRKLL